MSDLPSLNIKDVLQGSRDNYEKALQTGIKLQEDTINVWKDVFQKLGSPQELQAKLEGMTADMFPAARKQMDEVIETLSKTGNQALSLCEKTAALYKVPTLPETQRLLQEVTESYFAAARDNLKIASDANARIIGYWKDLTGRLVPAVK